jgi:hypothetical protein
MRLEQAVESFSADFTTPFSPKPAVANSDTTFTDSAIAGHPKECLHGACNPRSTSQNVALGWLTKWLTNQAEIERFNSSTIHLNSL